MFRSTALKLYGDLSDAQIATSISRVEAVTDETIDALVGKYWRGGDLSLRDELKLKLKTRRNNLLEQRDKLLEKLAQERKLAQVAEEAKKHGLVDPRTYDTQHEEWIDSLNIHPFQRHALQSFTGGQSANIRAYQRKGHASFVEWSIKEAREAKQMVRGGLGIHDAPHLLKVGSPEWEKRIREQMEIQARKVGEMAAHLEAALARGPSFQGTVWRGVRNMSPEDVKRQFGNVGGIIKLPESNSFASKHLLPTRK